MPSSPLRFALGPLVTGSMLLTPSGALGAITAAPLKPCYVSVAEGRTEPVDVVAAGFAAGAGVDVRVDGQMVATTRSSATGGVAIRVPAPHRPRGERSFAIELAEHDRPAAAIVLRSRVTALRVRLRTSGTEPRGVVSWIGRGFTGAGPVFAHYVRDGRSSRTQRLSAPRGACGSFRVRRRQFPFSPSQGRWIIQIDQQRRYAPLPASPFVRLAVSVRRHDHRDGH